MSINVKNRKIVKPFSISDLSDFNSEPIFVVFDSESKIKRESKFNVTFFIDGKNIVLLYSTVEDFVLDLEKVEQDKSKNLFRAFKEIREGLRFTTTTTALGFLILFFISDNPPTKHFGFGLTVGALLAYFLTLTMIITLLAF